MKKIIKLSANLLTISRIILVFFMLPYLFIREKTQSNETNYLFQKINCKHIFLFIFIFASITDILDGYIAKKITKQTVFGKFFDPIADKLLIIVSFFYIYILCQNNSLLLEEKDNNSIKNFILSILLIHIIRDFLIMGVRLVAFEKKTIISASFLGKIKTISTFLSILLTLLAYEIEEKISKITILIKFCLIINSILIIFSGIYYIIKNFKLIKNNFY